MITIVKKYIIDIILVIFLLILIIFIYRYLFLSFFQQDEWASLGFVLGHNSIVANVADYSFVQLLAGEGRILGSIINNFFDLYFPFQIWLFIVFALLFHWLNTILVYLLIKRLTFNRLVSFVSSTVFCVLFTPSGTLTWISAHTTVLPNCFFLLLSIHSYLSFISSRKKIHKYSSYLFVVVSLMFKESSLFLIFLYPIMDLIFEQKKTSILLKFRQHIPIYIYVCFIILLRYLSLKSMGVNAGVFVTRSADVPLRIFIHAFSYPVISFAQIFIPDYLLFKAANIYQNISYEFINNLPQKVAIQTILITDTLSVWLTLLMFTGLGKMYFVFEKYRKILVYGWIFLLLSFIPFIAIDRPLSSYLESRYYYVGAIGAAILIAGVLAGMHEYSRIWNKQSRILIMSALYLLIVLYAGKNIQFIKRSITSQIMVADERKTFLTSLTKLVEPIPDKPIFYISGDSPGFYGLADLTVPFQQGMGYTLMVWYYHTGKIPNTFLNTFYLWNINEQGYKEEQNNGFGYFWKKDDLLNEFANNSKLHPEQVIGLLYEGSTKKLINTTDEIRKEIMMSRL